MSKPHAPAPVPRPLLKQQSWSPDAIRDEAWQRRKGSHAAVGLCRSKSVSDDDLEELKACVELGLGFDPESSDVDPRLSDTIPALGFYCAVNKQYSNSLSRSSSSSSIVSDSDAAGSSNNNLFCPGDDAEMVKTRLKQWAQVVACAVRSSSR
ncbi:uncharacterized protein LOC107427053 [Ziziphus jujuba]|uniref:Uncharacterized protein LOC107427053 n=2 Tax=Ziziphus jujuba TaxID=326968 RepID=A0A6P4AUP5_ZIZJJ|nr:uncharacterized protein LOC107427053 [Ziziphus jujuba]KAH7517986.1 hypothetical protein FEM48_Zijuj09G0122600 [Ziziphus jujuba var. spinosa]